MTARIPPRQTEERTMGWYDEAVMMTLRLGRWSEGPAGAGRCRQAEAATCAAAPSRSLRFLRSLALFSWPQAAKMSRPRGVRIGAE